MTSSLRLISKFLLVCCLVAVGAAGAFYLLKTYQTEAASPSEPPRAANVPEVPQTPFTGQLRQAGVKACLHSVDRLAPQLIEGTTETNFASSWFAKAADAHVTSTFIGQKFGNNPNLPFGVAAIIAAPQGAERCDAASIRVLPSPLACDELQKAITQNGKLLVNLSGVPLFQTDGSQILLVPTAGRGCVMVETRVSYDE